MADGERVTVLFVMGHGSSGTTILGNTLGEVDGLFHAGELRTIWAEALAGLQQCGCGRPVRECPVWSKVLSPRRSGSWCGRPRSWRGPSPRFGSKRRN